MILATYIVGFSKYYFMYFMLELTIIIECIFTLYNIISVYLGLLAAVEREMWSKIHIEKKIHVPILWRKACIESFTINQIKEENLLCNHVFYS
jgi:hypothetical protein